MAAWRAGCWACHLVGLTVDSLDDTMVECLAAEKAAKRVGCWAGERGWLEAASLDAKKAGKTDLKVLT